MRAAPDRLPVTLLSGFLGSGKTSLLARLLRDPDLVDTAVIVNEFGEIGLDHLLIAPGSEEVLLLDAGCLCCTMQDSLADTLADLFHRRVRAEVPAFKRVVIETTGLAHPGPILRQLLTDRSITAHYALDGLVTTIDALHGARQLDAHPQALQQAAMADRLVVTKTDLTEGRRANGAGRSAAATQSWRADPRRRARRDRGGGTPGQRQGDAQARHSRHDARPRR